MPENEDFHVTIASKPSEDTVVLTSAEMTEQWLEKAMHNFNNNYHQYSTYLNESSLGSSTLTNEMIDILAQNAQSNLENIKQINSIIRYFINKDDLIGKVFESIEDNVNTDYKLSYKDFPKNRNKKITIDRAKEIIDDFNKQINIENLIRKSIPLAYSEGNYPMYLRQNGKGNYVVDYFPLGVLEVSDYELDGEPCLLINLNELKNKLQKTYKKNRNSKPLFFDNVEDDVKNNYPKEIYEAYKTKETYAKLDPIYSGILRVNNLNRKYGVSPIFKALKSAIMLETFEKTDRINAKAKGKKIIFQQLRKEVLGQDLNKKGFEEMSYAHDSFMAAWKNETVIYTGAGFVEDIKYIEPKLENINIDTINHYRSKMMTSLGIGFLNQDSKQTFTVANISIKELLKKINKIGEQLEDIIEKWYKVVLQENNIPIEYCPTIKIIDSEHLDIEIRNSLVETLFSKMNCSYTTTLELLGIDVEDEKQRREKENKEKFDEIFAPRTNAFTNSGKVDSKGGKPKGDASNPDSVPYHDDRNNAK